MSKSSIGARHHKFMPIKKRELYHGKYYRHGASYGVLIPPDLRELAGLTPGDQMVMNYSHGIIWLKRLDPSMVFDRTEIAKIFDELFPDKADTHAR